MKKFIGFLAWLFVLSLSFGRVYGDDTPLISTTIQALHENDAVAVKLKNRELVVGKFQKFETDHLWILSDTFGVLAIPVEQIEKIELNGANIEIQSELKKIPPKKIWESHINGGINGSRGNSTNMSLRASAGTKRTTDRNRLTAEGVYSLDYGTSDATGKQEQQGNRFNFDLRSEWPFPSYPRLNYFLAAAYQYDAFRECEQRVSGNTGLGFDIFKTEKVFWGVHGGAGVSKEFNCSEDDLRPEGVAGTALEVKLAKLQKLTFSADIFPDLKDLGEFRSVEKIAWTIFLTEAKKLNAGIGIEHRYDSTPGTSKPNDLDYFAMIGWLF